MRTTLVLFAVLISALLAGCTDFSPAASQRTNTLRIFDIDVSAPQVSAAGLVLIVNVTLDNTGAASGAVDVGVRAYDVATGLLVASNHSLLGNLARDLTKSVALGLELPRADAYRLDVTVAQNGLIGQNQEVTVSNLGGLTPNLHQARVAVNAMDFQVLGVTDGRVRLRATTALTSQSRGASPPLRLQLKAREVSTSLVADEKSIDVGVVGAGETRPFDVELAVPEHYNYRVEATVWDGPFIVQTGSGLVALEPTATLDAHQEVVTKSPDVRVFEPPGPEAAYDRAGGGMPATRSKGATPALGLVGLAAALAVALLVVRVRRSI